MVFLFLVEKIIPLIILMALGTISGKVFHVKKETLASLLIYIFAPIVIFKGIMTVDLTAVKLLLPLFFMVLAWVMCLCSYFVAKKLFESPTKNIFAFASASANTGYFGFPLIISLFGESYLGLGILIALGFNLYEYTMGYFITARSHFSVQKSIRRVLRIPTIYAFFIGVILNLNGVKLNSEILSFCSMFQNSFSVLGMMLIGLGISSFKRSDFDLIFIVGLLIIKFLFWPLLIFGTVTLDRTIFHFLDESIYKVMFLMSFVPLPGNAVAIATDLHAEPEKASMAVVISTILTLLVIPVGFYLVGI